MKTFAERGFEAKRMWEHYEEEFWDEVIRILDIEEGHYTYPFDTEHFRLDSYDDSFELYGCEPNLKLTPQQVRRFKALGFKRFWLNHTDGTESYY